MLKRSSILFRQFPQCNKVSDSMMSHNPSHTNSRIFRKCLLIYSTWMYFMCEARGTYREHLPASTCSRMTFALITYKRRRSNTMQTIELLLDELMQRMGGAMQDTLQFVWERNNLLLSSAQSPRINRVIASAINNNNETQHRLCNWLAKNTQNSNRYSKLSSRTSTPH